MEQYQNRDGVKVQAELVTDESSAFVGLWHTVDAIGIDGHVTDEQFQRNFTKVADAKPTTTNAAARG